MVGVAVVTVVGSEVALVVVTVVDSRVLLIVVVLVVSDFVQLDSSADDIDNGHEDEDIIEKV